MQWQEVIDNPYLKNLPFKIELNRWGRIEMSPASNRHALLQSRLAQSVRPWALVRPGLVTSVRVALIPFGADLCKPKQNKRNQSGKIDQTPHDGL